MFEITYYGPYGLTSETFGSRAEAFARAEQISGSWSISGVSGTVLASQHRWAY